MIETATVSPPNSLLLVMSGAGADVPISGEPVASTETCVSVGTLMELDGETVVRVMDADSALDENLAPLGVFAGSLSVSGGIVVSSVFDDSFVSWPCPDGEVPVRVFTNHSTEPDRIDVVIG